MKKSDYERCRQTLMERYPYMFSGETVGIQSSPRAERLAYAIDIEPGWFELIEQLCADIDAVVPAAMKRDDGKGFHIRQIKEKFGTLRFYWDVGIGPHEPIRIDMVSAEGGLISLRVPPHHSEPWRDEVNRLIDHAVLSSRTICFVCGGRGHLRQSDRWLYTSCNRHEGTRERFD